MKSKKPLHTKLRPHLALSATAIAVAAILSTNSALAAAECQVFTTDAAGTTIPRTSTPVVGGECFTGNYAPETHDDHNGQAIADGAGVEITLKSKGTIATGNSGFSSTRLNNPSIIHTDSSGATRLVSELIELSTGTQTNSVDIPDPISGTKITVKTFDTALLREESKVNQVVYPVGFAGDQLYKDVRFGTAKNGGKIKVNLDDSITGSTGAKTINLELKQSYLFEANTKGVIEWVGKDRRIYLNYATQTPAATAPRTLYNTNKVIYRPNVSFDGVTYAINDLNGLKAYNDALIAKLRSGKFPKAAGQTYEQAYADALKLAYTTEVIRSTMNNTIAAGANEGPLPTGHQWVMRAVGPDSQANVSGVLSVHRKNWNDLGGGAILIEGAAKGEIANGARLSAFNNAVVVKDANSSFVNNGVISAGLNTLSTTLDTSTKPVLPRSGDGGVSVFAGYDGGAYAAGYGVQVINDAKFENNGIINVASSHQTSNNFNYGIRMQNASEVKLGKESVINVSVSPESPYETNTSGVRIDTTAAGKNTTLISEGEIYIGRSAQFTRNAPTTEIADKNRTYGIHHKGKAEVTHSGKITIGSKIENAIGYFLDNVTDSKVDLTAQSEMWIAGDKLNNAIGAPPLTNYGVYALRTGNSVINADGKIFITGVNARAIQAEGNSTVNVAKSGQITVHGGRDIRQGTRNYGVYAEGLSNTDKPIVNFGGEVKLSGEGAIGLHARGHSSIINDGEVKMESGSDQIGYFIYGPDANIEVKPTVMGVDTDRSTMFRLAGGAKFDASGFTINTKGVGSNAITVTGSDEVSGQKSKANTVGGTFNLNGVNSNFLRVEGGAQAVLDSTSKVTLGARGVTIGIVDGESYDLFKQREAGKLKDDSVLETSLSTTTSLDEVNTYITRSRGNLDFKGSYINLYGKDSIAFTMQDGGHLSIAENASFMVNGDAIRSEDTNEESKLNRGETNTARLERNEINAINVLNARSGAVTVDSRGQSLLTGAALTDANANSRLSLSEETVWNITDNSKLTTLINRGTMNFVGQITDPKDRKQYQQLEIAGDYLGVGGSTLSVNSNWYQTEGVFTNTVVIKGDATGQTRVIATDGIGGDVKAPQAGETGSGIEMLADNRFLKYDSASPVISVLGSDNFDNGNPTFVGDAVIRDSAEQVQLIKKGRHYYWAMTGVLPAKESQKEEAKPVDTGKKIYVPETSAYLQTPYINRQQSFDLLGKLTDRVGEQQFDCDCLGPQSWSRLSYHDGYSQGKNRFGFGSKRGLVQFGQDLSFNMNETRRVHTGISVGYSWSQNRFYDKYRSENGYISADKETLGSKSQVASLGLYRTAYFANGSYLDLNLNGNWIHNQYKTENRHHKPSQNGYSLGASVETGRLFKLGESHWYVQPQAQLRAQYQHLNRFKDGSRQTEAKAQTGLQARLGARLTNGTFHVSADLVHDIIAPKTAVTIGNSRLEERYNPTTAELAVGGDIGLDSNGKWKLYSDAKYTRALGKANNVFGKKAPAESYNARIGVRYSW